jgi:ribosomal protein S12 methylthiotransferase
MALGEVDVPWIRMHYSYPTGLTPKVIKAIQSVPNVLPYLDLPLQHSHPDMLRDMNRPWHGRVNDKIIEQIKTLIPEAVMRTTLIVGFPGETESQFQHLLEFVQRHEFDHVGVFTYSAEEGTPAFSLPNQIPEEIKEARKDAIMSAQQEISLRKNQAEIGKMVEVLIEQEHPETGELIGRSPRFAPDVDGVVYLNDPQHKASLGEIFKVQITGADHYDLFGEIGGEILGAIT